MVNTARSLPIVEQDDVLAGLRGPRKRLPSRLLHDARGAELFEKLGALDGFYPAHAELELLERHLPQLAHQIGAEPRVIEPGRGSLAATRKLLRALERPTGYVTIDRSSEAVSRTAQALRREFPALDVQPVIADYTRGFELPVPQHEWRHSVVFFPGSAIGAFEPSEARAFLAMLGRTVGDDRLLLIGADGTRDPDELARAYDDDGGLSAALHKNALLHVDRTHGATFDPDAFEYRAVWNADASRMEMQLVSTRRQLVRVAGHMIAIAAGEAIATEHSYKHTPEALRALLAAGGWRPRQVFTSTQRPYRLWLCEPLAWSRPRG